MRRRHLLSAAAFLLLAACSPQDLVNALTPLAGLRRTIGAAYGPLPRHRLDLYKPDALAADAPILVFLHGGGWTSGRRQEYGFVAATLARLSLAVAVPDYRLWPETVWPGFIQDGALALHWLHRAEPGRALVVVGHSAGAFNAAALALDPRWGVRSLVRGLVGLAGPYDFDPQEVSPPEIFAALARVEAAPADVDLRGAPPTLLLHGAADAVVRPLHSHNLAARLRQAGAQVRHHVFPGLGHVGIIAALASPLRSLGLAESDVLSEIQVFLGQVRAGP